MASKEYISIVRLMIHADIPLSSPVNVVRARKQLQAEFAMARDGFIVVDEHVYTKQAVFEEIDHPDFAERFSYHLRIWNNPFILQLLEQKKADMSEIDAAFAPFILDRAFDRLISPFFASSFQYLSREYLLALDFEKLAHLLRFEDFLQPEEREEAFRPIRMFLDENVLLLKNVHAANYSIMRPRLVHWITADWAGFLNVLPAELFEQKEIIVTRLINLGVSIQKTHKRDCRATSSRLVTLTDIPSKLSELIISNHQVYTKPAAYLPRFVTMGGRGLFFLFWIVMILFRSIGSNGCGGGGSDRVYKYEMQAPLSFKDSVKVWKLRRELEEQQEKQEKMDKRMQN